MTTINPNVSASDVITPSARTTVERLSKNLLTPSLADPDSTLDMRSTKLPSYFPKSQVYTLQEVLDVTTPEPSFSETGRIWQPVEYQTVLVAMETALFTSGRKVLDVVYALDHGGMRMMALYAFEGLNGNYETSMLWTSHDKSSAIKLCAGTIYCACFNGIVSAELVLASKHTKNIHRRIPGLIAQGLGAVNSLRVNQSLREESYMATNITPGIAEQRLLQAVDDGGLTRTNFWKARAMYEDNMGEGWPEAYHELPQNVWRLYQAATTPGFPNTQAAKACSRLHHTFDMLCDFTPKTREQLMQDLENSLEPLDEVSVTIR